MDKSKKPGDERVQSKPTKAPPPLKKFTDDEPRSTKKPSGGDTGSFLPIAAVAFVVLGTLMLCGVGAVAGIGIWAMRAPQKLARIDDPPMPIEPNPLIEPGPPINVPIEPNPIIKKPIDVPIDPIPKKQPPVNVVQSFELKRCPINAEQEERPLPGVVRDIVVGGGGRFVIVSIPDKRQIAVFDVNEAKVVKYLPIPDDDAILAAGMEKLIVCLPNSNVIQRWNLRTLEREVTAPCPLGGGVKAATMGWSSGGPLLLVNDKGSQFIDPNTLKQLELQYEKDQIRFGPRLGLDARASGDGTVFTCMDHHSTVRVFTVRDGVVKQRAGGTSSFISAPGEDGTFICTMIGVYNTEMVELYPKTNQNGLIVSPFVAAKQGRMFFRIGQGGHDGPKNFNFFLLGNNQPFAVMPNFAGFDTQTNTYAEGNGRRSSDRRYNLLPNSEVLVALPATNDRLLLRRFNMRELLDKSGVDYLMVTSVAPTVATRGQAYRYDMSVLAKKGGVKYRVDSGPPGMKISAQGQVTWPVPRTIVESQLDIILTVSDAAGQETFHTFRLFVKD